MIHIGDTPAGERVEIPEFHTSIFGQSGTGKTKLLKYMMSQVTKQGFNVLIFDSKVTGSEFEGIGAEIPFYLEAPIDEDAGAIDPDAFRSLIEGMRTDRQANMDRYRGGFIAICHGAQNFTDVGTNLRAKLGDNKIRGGTRIMYEEINHDYHRLMKLLEKHTFSQKLQLPTGAIKGLGSPYIVRMPTWKLPNLALQGIVVRSVVENMLRWAERTIFLVDEAPNFCLSDDTEILTFHGWKKHGEIKEGDPVYTYDLHLKELDIQRIKQVITRHVHEPVTAIRSPSLDILATRDHYHVIEEYLHKNRMDWVYLNPEKRQTKDLPKFFRLPVSAPHSEGTENVHDEVLQTLAWIITEGSIIKYKDKPYLIRISQSERHLENVGRIRSQLDSIGIIYTETKRSRSSTGQKIGLHSIQTRTPEHVFTMRREDSKWFLSLLNNEPHSIPQWVFAMSYRKRRLFYDEMMKGDGTLLSNGLRYYAGDNQQLADQFQWLCLTLGFRAAISKYKNGQWNVQISHRHPYQFVRRQKHVSTVPYKGTVWCITVPNGTFIARRNGKAFITGNCPQKGYSPAKASLQDLDEQGRKPELFGWYSGQTLTGFDKQNMKNVWYWIMGREMERNEAKDVVDTQTHKALTVEQVKQLKVREFVVSTPDFAKLVTVPMVDEKALFGEIGPAVKTSARHAEDRGSTPLSPIPVEDWAEVNARIIEVEAKLS